MIFATDLPPSLQIKLTVVVFLLVPPRPYCHKLFSPQGYSVHIKTHQLDPNAKPKARTRFGKVKLRDIPTPTMNEVAPTDVIADTTNNNSTDKATSGNDDETPNDDAAEMLHSDNEFDESLECIGDDDGIGDEEPSSGDKRNVNGGRSRSQQLKPHEIIMVLDEWHSQVRAYEADKASGGIGKIVEPTKGSLIKWAAAKLNQPKLQRKTFNGWLKDEAKIRSQPKHRTSTYSNVHQGVARSDCISHFPSMENKLAVFIRNFRLLGPPVEFWMVIHEGKHLLRQESPDKYPSEEYIELYGDDDLDYPLKFSWQWCRNFFNRHNFSFRKLGTKMNKAVVTPSMIESIADYHISQRVFQLSEMNDDTYGITSVPMIKYPLSWLLQET
jgi:hypothetical protein